ncbi:hypothetical protein DN069_35840 [Streptacidiphilus pinicola]|uniref:Uncharacterized protein n=1 Tax=Streptacidiphilus pinicola TaxID=2219663 RepID=A0A2X0K0K8_9ACTN|nr:hypothetical protein [Streptacidiphilus pinicola]RAG80880.1 hypothetical protein DN069_35840 [Streptacidiphilus pinicola]
MSVPQLDEAMVLVRNERDSTTFDVLPGRSEVPVVRLYKPYFYDSPHPLQVFTGPRLDTPAGWVTAVGAKDVERVMRGTVSHEPGSRGRRETWTAEQPGLPALTGVARGTGARLRHGTTVAAVPLAGALEMAFEYRVRFRGPADENEGEGGRREGFEFARLKGVHPRYSLRIHDRRIGLLLALAAVVRYDWQLSPDPKKGLMDLTFPKRA